MPCRSDYMEPTSREKYVTETAQLLTFVLNRLGLKIPPNVSAAAAANYPGTDLTDHFTRKLCTLIRGMSAEQQETIIYDGRNTLSRRLADWWDRHEAADKARISEEQRVAILKTKAKAFLNALTQEERRDVVEAIKTGLAE